MPPSFKKIFIFATLGIVLLVCIASASIHYTSTNQFCLSCHEMRVHYKELALSPHARDLDGKEIACAKCHIPAGNIARMVGAKMWMGSMDVWVHFTGGANDLDRSKMQLVARRFTDDANCLKCHDDLTRNARKDCSISPEGALAHANYRGTNGQSRSGCVGCHVNLAHLPPFDARIPKNQSFAYRIKELNNDPS